MSRPVRFDDLGEYVKKFIRELQAVAGVAVEGADLELLTGVSVRDIAKVYDEMEKGSSPEGKAKAWYELRNSLFIKKIDKFTKSEVDAREEVEHLEKTARNSVSSEARRSLAAARNAVMEREAGEKAQARRNAASSPQAEHSPTQSGAAPSVKSDDKPASAQSKDAAEDGTKADGPRESESRKAAEEMKAAEAAREEEEKRESNRKAEELRRTEEAAQKAAEEERARLDSERKSEEARQEAERERQEGERRREEAEAAKKAGEEEERIREEREAARKAEEAEEAEAAEKAREAEERRKAEREAEELAAANRRLEAARRLEEEVAAAKRMAEEAIARRTSAASVPTQEQTNEIEPADLQDQSAECTNTISSRSSSNSGPSLWGSFGGTGLFQFQADKDWDSAPTSPKVEPVRKQSEVIPRPEAKKEVAIVPPVETVNLQGWNAMKDTPVPIKPVEERIDPSLQTPNYKRLLGRMKEVESKLAEATTINTSVDDGSLKWRQTLFQHAIELRKMLSEEEKSIIKKQIEQRR